MGRIASRIVLLAVACVAVAAGVDAALKAAEPKPARAEPKPRPIEGLTLLSGRLRWTDERCRLHVTSLVTLQEIDRPRTVRCESRARRAVRRAPSPSGRHRAVATGRSVVVVKDGVRVRLPLAGVRSLAWSPDERWLAAAGRGRVYLVRILGRDLRVREIPVDATWIDWVRR